MFIDEIVVCFVNISYEYASSFAERVGVEYMNVAVVELQQR